MKAEGAMASTESIGYVSSSRSDLSAVVPLSTSRNLSTISSFTPRPRPRPPIPVPEYLRRQREHTMKATKRYTVSFIPSLGPKPIPISSHRLPVEACPWSNWTNPAIDRLICCYDALGFSTLEIMWRIKLEFPILRFRVLSPDMLERRIETLDQQPEIDYFKDALKFSPEQIQNEIQQVERARQLGFFVGEEDDETMTRRDALGDTQANASALAHGKLKSASPPQLEVQIAKVEEIDEPRTENASLESAAEQITSRGARQGLRIHASTPSASTVALGEDYTPTSSTKPLTSSQPSRGVKHGQAMHRAAAKNVDENHAEKHYPSPETGAFAAPLGSGINTTRYSRGARNGQKIQQAAQAWLKDVANTKTPNSSNSSTDATPRATTIPSISKNGTLRVTNGLAADRDSQSRSQLGGPIHPARSDYLTARPESSVARCDSMASELGRTPEVFQKKRSLASLNGRVRIRDSIDITHLQEMKKRASEEVSGIAEVVDK